MQKENKNKIPEELNPDNFNIKWGETHKLFFQNQTLKVGKRPRTKVKVYSTK